MKILVPTFEFFAWRGGQDFLLHILRGLCGIKETVLHVAVEERMASCESIANQFPSDIRSSVRLLPCRDDPGAVIALTRQHDIEVALPFFSPPSGDFPIPWIGYIYDFQHRYLPQYFSETEIRERDISFAAMMSKANVVICNSRSVRDDANRFFPSGRPIVALPCAPCPQQEWFDCDVESVRGKHGIDRPYFMICNQFWMHKDYPTAFIAFRLLLDAQPERRAVRLVCTGLNSDYRNPEYAGQLIDMLRRLNIDKQVSLVGVLPKAEQLALLRGTLGLIQPTGFEGGPGGGAVRDAMSLGTPILVSEIPVNREIPLGYGRLSYFPLGNSERLAALMAELTAIGDSRPTKDHLLRRGRRRRQALSRALRRAIDLARRSALH
jgi:glycosyltransferase involved in cell wall biosynthesis